VAAAAVGRAAVCLFVCLFFYKAERLCQRCSCSAVDDEAHMIWGCPALIDQRVQHSELFEDSTITSVSDFLQQDAGQLAPFLRVCHDHCAELEGYGSSRV
jgi:hypothetical protein